MTKTGKYNFQDTLIQTETKLFQPTLFLYFLFFNKKFFFSTENIRKITNTCTINTNTYNLLIFLMDIDQKRMRLPYSIYNPATVNGVTLLQ